MDDSLIDDLLDDCSQLRVLIVGASRGKAQLIREMFGVARLMRYPPDFSRDEEVYSKENNFFVTHVFDTFEGVEEVVKRRRKGDADEVIHAIWHYVDAQDAAELLSGASELSCPAAVRNMGIPVITIFGRFDNIVTRSQAIGALRRQDEPLSEQDLADAVQIRAVLEAIQLYLMQFPETTVVTSKLPGSKLKLVDVTVERLKTPQAKMLFVSAQRLSTSLKLDTSLQLAMKQFLVATIGSSVPIPIPFAGYAATTAVTSNIKTDIVKVWNLYDPELLLTGTHNNTTMMDTLMNTTTVAAKTLIYMIPGISLIKGVLELPLLARSLSGLMIDLTLIMERLFVATMLGANVSELAATPARAPMTPIRLENRDSEKPFSPEVIRARQELMSFQPNHSGTPARAVVQKNRPTPPPKPPRPGAATPPAKPPRPGQSSPMPQTPQTPQPTASVITATPLKPLTRNVLVQPATSAVSRDMLDSIVKGYEPTKLLVAAELEEFFDYEGSGLTRAFQKDTVQRKLAEIVSHHRLSKPFA
jgi:hypothetical protein